MERPDSDRADGAAAMDGAQPLAAGRAGRRRRWRRGVAGALPPPLLLRLPPPLLLRWRARGRICAGDRAATGRTGRTGRMERPDSDGRTGRRRWTGRNRRRPGGADVGGREAVGADVGGGGGAVWREI
jgi:hypothetical protein